MIRCSYCNISNILVHERIKPIETLDTSSSSSNCKLRVVQRMYLTKTFCCIVTEAKIIPNDSQEIDGIELQLALRTCDSC